MFLLLAMAPAIFLTRGEPVDNPFMQHEKLALTAAAPNLKSVPRYGKFELSLALKAAYDNPFDPDQVQVTAEFTPPKGKPVTVDGFLYQEYRRKLDNNAEALTAAGEPVWKVRFAPDNVGTWKYRISAKDRSGVVHLPVGSFRVVASKDPGYVRRSARNPLGFAYDGEKQFFAVGENMGWAGQRGTYDYEDWLKALGAAGGNWIRVWMNSWNAALEWTPGTEGQWTTGGYHGVGVYNLANAWKLDTILDTADKNGVKIMLCFGTYGEFKEGGFFGEGQWKANPYNIANGGPCAKPDDFWTNATARKFYQRRLRYIMARYGYRTGIHSWEFWNEAEAPAPWIGEMARYLKGTGEFRGHVADPYRHLVTTTYGNDAVWKIPEIDFSQSHHYGTGDVPDHAPVVNADARQNAVYNKPHLMGEFGIDWRDTDSKYDPEGLGINMHNGIWSSIASGNAGTAMLWYWDNYVHPKHVYQPFVAARRFADVIPWTSGPWKALACDPARVVSGPETFSDLSLMTNAGWRKTPKEQFKITPRGLESNDLLPQFLFSPGKPELRMTPSYRVNYAKPGRFVVRVGDVSTAAKFRFTLDGQKAGEFAFSAQPPSDPNVKPEYEKVEQNKEYGNYVATFNKEIGIDIPAGEHTIRLDLYEGDWARLDSLTLTGYRSSRYPEVNLYGVVCGKQAILWAQNARHTWRNAQEKRPVPTVSGAVTAVHGLPDGRYTVEWWDTTIGSVLKRDAATCRGGALPLRLPDLPTDVAARILPGGSAIVGSR